MDFKIIKEKPTCNCGIFGAFGIENSAIHTYYGLHSLQHRGQEASGIVAKQHKNEDKNVFNIHKGIGLVSEVYHDQEILKNTLSGFSAIGHNRYSTTGSSQSRKNIQPLVVNYRMGNLAVSHNGNLTNAKEIRRELINEGAIFQTSSDTEVILHLIARCKLENQTDQILHALNKVEGAYSVLILTDKMMVGARDPLGFRPLCIGKLKEGYVITSETCALDINQAEFIREVEPGEVIIIDDEVIKTGNIKSLKLKSEYSNRKQCIFEYIYFSRPDSRIFGHNVDKIRRKLGKILALKHPVYSADDEKVIVMSVPDSSNTAALGYQNQLEKMGIKSKLEIGLIRSHYIGRTFIQPGQTNREIGVRIKFNTVKGVLENRNVVIVDDSIVRGTTSKQLVNLIKEANPKSVHLRISSPPIKFPCFYGMDFPSHEELIANQFNGDIESIRDYLGVDSLQYLSEEELLEAMVDQNKEDFCTACFTGNYPTKVNLNFFKEENES